MLHIPEGIRRTSIWKVCTEEKKVDFVAFLNDHFQSSGGVDYFHRPFQSEPRDHQFLNHRWFKKWLQVPVRVRAKERTLFKCSSKKIDVGLVAKDNCVKCHGIEAAKDKSDLDLKGA